MMKMNNDEYKPEDITKKKKAGEFDNQYDVLQGLINVESDIKNDLNKDYILMTGDYAKEDFIKENLENVYFAKKIWGKYADKKMPKWDAVKGEWIKDENGELKMFPLKQEDQDRIRDNVNKMFNFLMLSSHSIAILNRNKDKNFILKLLGRYDERVEDVQAEKESKSIFKRIKEKITGKKDDNDSEGD